MSDERNTQPTVETLLSRLNEWGESLKQELIEVRTSIGSLRSGQTEIRAELADLRKNHEEMRNDLGELRKGQEELRKGQEELRKGYEELRADLRAGLHRVERKLQVLNDSFLTIQADIRDLEVRVEKLETEPLTNK